MMKRRKSRRLRVKVLKEGKRRLSAAVGKQRRKSSRKKKPKLPNPT
jgi:hypothetical protein